MTGYICPAQRGETVWVEQKRATTTNRDSLSLFFYSFYNPLNALYMNFYNSCLKFKEIKRYLEVVPACEGRYLFFLFLQTLIDVKIILKTSYETRR